MPLFQSAVLNKYLKQQDSGRVAAAHAAFAKHFHDPTVQANIRDAKEEQYQEGFLRDLFVNVLGYTLNPQAGYELTSEFKNEKGSKKADGAILVGGKALAVIELKGTDTTDLATINTQAFGYKANHTECVYVVTSNYQKLRFFIDNAVEWLEFDLFTLNAEQFQLLWLCLQRDNLLGGIPKKVKAESVQEEEQVTKRLYKDYSAFKTALWQDLCANHPDQDKLHLYKKSQKLLDRFLFVLFSEDKGLLPPNTLRGILTDWKKLIELDEHRPLYERCQKYFGYLNTGFKSATQDIFAYNGGLFKPDELLDTVRISDAVLETHLDALTKYDFASEVDVNILGHIFEHSLNEIEAITAQIEGRALDTKKTKRKKDGVFYTPKYITKYIVENTVGRLCTEKKDELALNDEEYAKGRKGRQKKTIQELDTKLEVYRDWLLSLTICDPACGSGAFLNQALDFLISEHQYVNELESKLLGQSIVFKDIGDHILERNIYGVDINEESVEIARLSLWLRTATKGRKLNDLSGNIKCGNSLIDDPAVAGAKAFDWKKEFPTVFAKGGFDVVVGNPPWGAELEETSMAFLSGRHPLVSVKNKDSYLYFIDQSWSLMKKKTGVLGFIVPNTWLLINTAAEYRRHLLQQDVISITDYGDGVFADATVESCTLVARNQTGERAVLVERVVQGETIRQSSISKNNWLSDPLSRIVIEKNNTTASFLDKLQRGSLKFEECADIIWGIKPYQVGHGTPPQTKEMMEQRVYHSASKVDEGWKPLVVGSNVDRYLLKTEALQYILYGPNLMYPSNQARIEGEKILMRQTSDCLRAVTDQNKYYPQNSVFVITVKEAALPLSFLMLLLNSKLLNYVYGVENPQKGKAFAEIKPSVIKALPIRVPKDFNGFVSKANEMLTAHAEYHALTKRTLDLLRFKYTLPTLSRALENWPGLEFMGFLAELKKAKVQMTLAEEAEWLTYFTAEKAKAQALQVQIAKTDKEIDALVYQLYGLTEEEIAVVEGKN
jgi:type I restriction-modification system DNA methylase subunit